MLSEHRPCVQPGKLLNLAGLAVNRPSLRSWDASSNPDWSSSFCTCPCLSLRIRGGMRGTRGARRGPSNKGLCQVQGGCSLREADGRSGGHPMVDRISLPKARNIKSMSWITPAGATLSRNLRISTCFRAVYWVPQFERQSLVCLRAGRLSLSGAPAGVSKASCGIGEIASREERYEMRL